MVEVVRFKVKFLIYNLFKNNIEYIGIIHVLGEIEHLLNARCHF
jgi:hypothetical protein